MKYLKCRDCHAIHKISIFGKKRGLVCKECSGVLEPYKPPMKKQKAESLNIYRCMSRYCRFTFKDINATSCPKCNGSLEISSDGRWFSPVGNHASFYDDDDDFFGGGI